MLTPQAGTIYNKFIPPLDWGIDLRTGKTWLPNRPTLTVEDNTITFLSGHKEDYSAYDNLGFTANVEGGYDVYIDNNLYGHYASGATCAITWSTSGIQTGFDVTTPEVLKAHIVQIKPSVLGNNVYGFAIKRIDASKNEYNGILWCHNTFTNSFTNNFVFGASDDSIWSYILQCFSSKNEKIKVRSTYAMFQHCTALKFVPTIDIDTSVKNSGIGYRTIRFTSIKYIKILNAEKYEAQPFVDYDLEKIDINTVPEYNSWGYFLWSLYKLRQIPNYKISQNVADLSNSFQINSQLMQPTKLDFSDLVKLKRVIPAGRWLKGLIVSPNAPFDGASPQIKVNNTGLSRDALVNLFKSMPYNVGYNVVGSPTIVDGVVSGFSGSDYLAISNYSVLNNNIEINLCFTLLQKQSGFTSYGYILAANNIYDGIQISFEDDSRTYECIRVRFGNGTTSSWCNTQIPIIYGQQYTLNIKFNKGTATIVGTVNGNSYTEQYTPSNTVVFASQLKFGCRGRDEQINGSIDLNSTYIKVNYVPWFTGKASMTKTCSIVGATGTSDLTQEDKAIALDKGWSLILS